MAVIKLTCPECKTVLKPAKPLPAGKAVKCPECGNRFTAAEDAPEAPLKKPKKAAAAEPEEAERKPKKSADAPKGPSKKSAGKKPTPEKKPAAKKSGDDDDEGGGVYGYIKEDAKEEDDKPEIEYAPDMSIKDLRGPAQAVLVQPSNALIIVGGLGFLGWIGLLLIILVPKLFPIDNDEGDKTKPPKPVVGLEHGLQAMNGKDEPTAEPKNDPSRKAFFSVFGLDLSMLAQFAWWVFLLCLLPIFLGMAYSGCVAYGAVKIQNLEGYGWGMAACIMAMIPLNSGGFIATTAVIVRFLLGMVVDDPKFLMGVTIGLAVLEALIAVGVGVWTLLTLLSDKVVAGYEYKAE